MLLNGKSLGIFLNTPDLKTPHIEKFTAMYGVDNKWVDFPYCLGSIGRCLLPTELACVL